MSDSAASASEPVLEIIPDGRDLIASVTLSRGTTFQVAGWTNEIVELANAILAAESKWMPGELLAFARDVLASGRTRVLPIEADPSYLDDVGDARGEDEFQKMKRAREAMKRFGTLVRGILYEVAKRLEREARELSESSRPETVQ